MQSQPISFQPPLEEAPAYRLPDPRQLFSNRAQRFESLAKDHQLGDWLRFLARLSEAQHDAIQHLPAIPLPTAAELSLANTHRMPPLSAATLTRPAAWQDVMRQLATTLKTHAPEATQEALAALAATDSTTLEAMAQRLLSGEPAPGDTLLLPFVAAALQVLWTHLASQLQAQQLQALDAQGVCPCCGSLPTISVLRSTGAIENLRYLHCSLCNTEWNVPRATCTACGDDKSVALHEIEGSQGLVRAETCDECKSYLKILAPEKDPQADPIADDLASLALDLLVDEAGYGRSGPNLLLLANTETSA